jgi:eukaryotic-like serine/threonine-protein kinase
VEERVPNLLHLGLAHGVLGQVAAGEGNLPEALAQARWACEVLAPLTPFLTLARRLLCALLLAAGEVDEAQQVALLALEQATAARCAGIAEVGLLVTLGETYLAQGDTAAGEQALRKALQSFRSRASEIADEDVRERFLHHVPDHARALALAGQYLGE